MPAGGSARTSESGPETRRLTKETGVPGARGAAHRQVKRQRAKSARRLRTLEERKLLKAS